MWPLLERHSKTVALALRFVVLCLLQVHSADVNQHGLCAWVRVSKTPLNKMQSILPVAERLIESTGPRAQIDQHLETFVDAACCHIMDTARLSP